ncbi:MAG: hypothetical protein R3B95_19840 [Nitrospirales bacterium]|nr:hypothetical protein [Nitrospirales bacterium]
MAETVRGEMGRQVRLLDNTGHNFADAMFIHEVAHLIQKDPRGHLPPPMAHRLGFPRR